MSERDEIDNLRQQVETLEQTVQHQKVILLETIKALSHISLNVVNMAIVGRNYYHTSRLKDVTNEIKISTEAVHGSLELLLKAVKDFSDE